MDLSIFFNTLGSITFAGIIVYGVKKYVQYGIKKTFDIELAQYKSDLQKENEEHRSELTRELEGLKHRQQMLYKDFELYTSKIHETYPELYKHIETAIGFIMNLRGYGRSLNYENTDKADLQKYFEEIYMTKFDQTRILNLWEHDKEGSKKEINKTIRLIKYNEAHLKWNEANDYFIYNELFYTEEVSSNARELLDILYRYLDLLDPQFAIGGDAEMIRQLQQEQKELKDKKIPEARKKLKLQLKMELSNSMLIVNNIE